MKVRNCIRCGQLFCGTAAEICPDCFHSAQEQEERVFQFLKDNGGHGTLEEIASTTGVPKSVVLTMVKRGWFLGEFSIDYPCERCGVSIEGGNLCLACSRYIRDELQLGYQSTTSDKATTATSKSRFYSRESNTKR